MEKTGFAHLYKPIKIGNPYPLVSREPDEEDKEVETPKFTPKDPQTAAVENIYKQPVEVTKIPETPDYEEEEKKNVFNFQDPKDRSYIFDSQLWAESAYNPNAVGLSGEQGIAQFMPETRNDLISWGWISKDSSPFDVDSSLIAQKKYMLHLYDLPYVQNADTESERIKRTLAAYNWGMGNLSRNISKAINETGNANNWINYAPPTKKKYIDKILKRAKTKKSKGAMIHYSWD